MKTTIPTRKINGGGLSAPGPESEILSSRILQRLAVMCAAAALSLSGHSVQAAAYDWIGATNTTWNLGWTGGNIPTTSDDLTILGPSNAPGALTIDVAATAAARTINITDSATVTLSNTTSGSNKTLTLQNGLTTGTGAVTIGSATANQAVQIALSAGFGQTWNIGSGGLTIGNSITRNTGATVNIVASSGVVTSTPAMSLNRGIFYNGDYATATAGGAVSAINYGVTGSTFNVSGAMGTVTNGAFYNMTANASVIGQNFGPGTVRFGGNFTFSATGTATSIGGFLTNGATAAVISGGGALRQNGEMVFATNGSSDQLTVGNSVTTFNSGVITSVTKAGAGTLIFTTNNTYNGNTVVNQGTLQTSSDKALGFGAAMGAINLGNSNTTVGAGATLDLAPASAMTVNEAIVLNGGALTNSGSGTTTIESGIAAVNLTNLGTGTATSGTVSFGGSGSLATATVAITGGAISSFTLTNAGSGYTGSTPVNITTTGSTGAAATAILSSVALNGANTIGGTGNLIINAVVADGTSSGGFSKTGNGTLTMNGINTYTGSTTVTAGTLLVSGGLTATSGLAVSGGTLRLGAADVLNNAATLTLSGGTFSTGAASGFSETLGTLDLNTAGTLTLALGTGVHSLSFANSSAIDWTGSTLTITGWTGTAGSSGTAGRIFFGSNATGLTAGQLSQINFSGYANGASILSTGEIVAVPESSTWALLAFSLTTVLILRRRRTA